MGITFTDGQKEAIDRLLFWYKIENEQVFTLFGYAGTGKTTIIRYIIDELGLSIGDSCKFIAYTGKAAIVMTRKGTPATTIHKLIYDTVSMRVSEKDKEGNPVLDSNGNPKFKDIFSFQKKLALPPNIKLLILDEASMITQQIWDDLKSFGIKIIVLGDPGQLPPPKGGEGPMQKLQPDYFLTEVMRQAQDNPVIYLSMLIREGKYIEPKRYGKRCIVLPQDEITDKMFNLSDIIIVGKNETRKEINNYVRNEILGIKKDIPVKGDKLICRNNRWDLNLDEYSLVNGMAGYLMDDIKATDMDLNKAFALINFRPDFLNENMYFQNLKMDLTAFRDLRYKRNDKDKKEITTFEFAYAITEYLSQGDSWKKVLYYQEFYGSKTLRMQRAYTAITRTEDLLIWGVPAYKRYY